MLHISALIQIFCFESLTKQELASFFETLNKRRRFTRRVVGSKKKICHTQLSTGIMFTISFFGWLLHDSTLLSESPFCIQQINIKPLCSFSTCIFLKSEWTGTTIMICNPKQVFADRAFDIKKDFIVLQPFFKNFQNTISAFIKSSYILVPGYLVITVVAVPNLWNVVFPSNSRYCSQRCSLARPRAASFLQVKMSFRKNFVNSDSKGGAQ